MAGYGKGPQPLHVHAHDDVPWGEVATIIEAAAYHVENDKQVKDGPSFVRAGVAVDATTKMFRPLTSRTEVVLAE
ncbi:MAG: hypothetical protein ACI9MR_000349 [Myxococcota bacterium]|jgi:hypothetical protein